YTVSGIPSNPVTRNAVLNLITHKMLFQGTSSTGTYPQVFSEVDTLCSLNTSSSSVSSLTTNIVQIYFSTYDSTYVCVGAMKTTKSGSWFLSKLCISKYDQNLKLLWHKTYGQNSIYNSLDKAVILPDGSIVASGIYSELTSIPLSNADNNGVIIKVDKD